MGNDEALKILRALADGVDPLTGEILPDASPYQSAQITRALYVAMQALEYRIESEVQQSTGPMNAGKPWSEDEDRRVVAEFDSGTTVKKIAELHGRTSGAIRSRLVKLGKIDAPRDSDQ